MFEWSFSPVASLAVRTSRQLEPPRRRLHRATRGPVRHGAAGFGGLRASVERHSWVVLLLMVSNGSIW